MSKPEEVQGMHFYPCRASREMVGAYVPVGDTTGDAG